MRLKDIEYKLEAVEELRDELLEEKAKALSRKKVKCTSTSTFQGPGCGKSFQIGSLTYIQSHFYVSPHGCTGGDYWSAGDGGFKCPKCGFRNRFHEYDRKEFKELDRYFKDIEDEHKN